MVGGYNLFVVTFADDSTATFIAKTATEAGEKARRRGYKVKKVESVEAFVFRKNLEK